MILVMKNGTASVNSRIKLIIILTRWCLELIYDITMVFGAIQNEVEKLTTPTPSVQKIEISLDADLVNKLKTKADAANKTPSEVVAEILREQLK